MLRRLLVLGATARLRLAKRAAKGASWVARLLARRPFKVVAVALANRMVRIAWALLAKGGTYRAPATAA
jgi:transposase